MQLKIDPCTFVYLLKSLELNRSSSFQHHKPLLHVKKENIQLQNQVNMQLLLLLKCEHYLKYDTQVKALGIRTLHL